MTLNEIIKFTGAQVLGDRPKHVMRINDDRVLVNDRTLKNLLDEAQDDAAMHSHCFIDRRSPGTAIYPLSMGQSEITLSPLTLALYDPIALEWPSHKRILYRVKRELFFDDNKRVPDCFTVEHVSGKFIILSFNTTIKEPATTLKTIVARKALARFQGGDLNKECELPSQFHDRLTDYVLTRVTVRRDVDKESKKDAQAAAKRWYDTKQELASFIYRLSSEDNLVYANPQF